MKLAYLSPLPPSRSGVSEYSVDLLPHLFRHAEVSAFAEPPSGGVIGGVVPVGPPDDASMLTRSPAVPENDSTAFCPGAAMVIPTPDPPGVIVVSISAGTEYIVSVTLPVFACR